MRENAKTDPVLFTLEWMNHEICSGKILGIFGKRIDSGQSKLYFHGVGNSIGQSLLFSRMFLNLSYYIGIKDSTLHHTSL